MKAEIEVQNKEATVLLEEAVVRFENKSFLFVKRDTGKFEMPGVQTGITENGFTEISITDDKLKKMSL